jgi:hypothetical protein
MTTQEHLFPHSLAPCDPRPTQNSDPQAESAVKDIPFSERCDIAEKCLPVAPYRDMLASLHREMLARIAELEAPIDEPQKSIVELPKPIFNEVAPGIEIGYNLWGGADIRLGGQFTYVKVNYNHEYTDNATRTRLVENIAKLISGSHVLKPIAAKDEVCK